MIIYYNNLEYKLFTKEVPTLLAGLIRYVYWSSGGCVISKNMSPPYSYSFISAILVCPFTSKYTETYVIIIYQMTTCRDTYSKCLKMSK